MIAITAEEKKIIHEQYPDVHIACTMKQDSKRHHSRWEIMQMANINTSIKRQSSMFGQLRDVGMIRFSKQNVNPQETSVNFKSVGNEIGVYPVVEQRNTDTVMDSIIMKEIIPIYIKGWTWWFRQSSSLTEITARSRTSEDVVFFSHRVNAYLLSPVKVYVTWIRKMVK